MARIALLTLEAAGHLIPTGCVGLELQRRGHEVTVVGSPSARPLTEQLGLRFQPLTTQASGDDGRITPGQRLAALVRQGAYGPHQVRLIHRAAATFQYAPDVLRDLRTEAMIVDQNPLSGATIAEHLRLPYVTVFSALMGHEEPLIPPLYTTWKYEVSRRARWRNRMGYLGLHGFLRALLRYINQQRAAWRLSPRQLKSDHYSPFAQISPLIPELDFPRQTLPDVCHYVGSLGANRPEQNVEFPWEKLDGRPLIFASVGTMASPKNSRILPVIAAACQDFDAQLVIALGKWRETAGAPRDVLKTVASNTIVVDFAPQIKLLQRAAVLITHAGQNTVMEAISQGVPMIALPRNADQPGIAARVEYAGVGLRESFQVKDPAVLRAKVDRVLREEAFRRRAQALCASNTRAGGAARAAEIFERVLAERRPITRQEMVPN
jgi:zeaxanthin glucosyltransferase